MLPENEQKVYLLGCACMLALMFAYLQLFNL